MNASKLISTMIAAAAVAGGISVAVAQSAMPPTPEQDTGTKKDVEATGAMRPMDSTTAQATQTAPAPSSSGSTDASSGSSAATPDSSSEPAAQPTRG